MNFLVIILLLLSVIFIIVSTVQFKLHPFLALLFATIFYGLFSGIPLENLMNAVTKGFGNTIGSIGIVIVAGTIIGTFLEKSAGAFRLAESILRFTGKKNVPLAMGIIGYIVSIPVYCDSGFVILSPLNKALAKKVNISLATSAIALSLGLYTTHTMVPPTPGPIAAAGILNADLGLVILWGVVVSIPAFIIGWLFSITVASKIYIEPEPGITEEYIKEKIKDAPAPFKAFLPILFPIILIVTKSVSDFPSYPLGIGNFYNIIGFLGHPVIALIIGIFISFTLPKKFDKAMLSSSGWVGEGILNSSIIILITAAGGAFGQVLRESGIAEVIGGSLVNANMGIWLPFIIAASIKTAQGSSTVAIITTASLMAPLLETLGFVSPNGIALVVVAIGAGAMVISHANDSYFWVVTQFSGMDVKTGYKLQSLGTLVEGVSAALVVWGISLIIL